MTRSAMPKIRGYKNLSLFNKQGGMGTIYRGYAEKTGKEVIIKLMDSSIDTREHANKLRRFTQEIYVIKMLGANNPEHILAAIEHGEIRESRSQHIILYLIYPYIKDGSLSSLLDKEKPWQKWSLLHVVDIIMQAAEGLTHLHKLKIVHQDVKPGNFLWSPANSTQNLFSHIYIWLIDFGAAALEGESLSSIGTPGYMAPEQELGHIRCSADQYSLAVMARLLLTGCHPHLQVPTLDTPLTRLNPDRLFSQEIDHVVLQALDEDPEKRFGSVTEFAEALKRAILRQERPTFYTDRTEPLSPQSLIQSSLSATQQETKPPPPVPEVPVVIPPKISFLPHQIVNETFPQLPQKHGAISSISSSLPSFPLQKQFTLQLPNKPTMLSWSPDGTTLVCTFHEDAPKLIHNNQKVEILSDFVHGHCACWSPNSRFLAISISSGGKSQDMIRFCDRTEPKERYHLLQIHNGTPIYGLDWSSAGLLAVWLERGLDVYDLSSFSVHTQLPVPYASLSLNSSTRSDRRTTLRWSPDGVWLAAGANNGKVICWNPHTSALWEQQPFTRSVDSTCWSPDSTNFVTAFANKRVMFWDLHAGSRVWEPLPERPTMISFSPQTAQLAAATQKMLFFGHIDDPAPTISHSGQLLVAWSPANKLATLDQNDKETLVIWQA